MWSCRADSLPVPCTVKQEKGHGTVARPASRVRNGNAARTVLVPAVLGLNIHNPGAKSYSVQVDPSRTASRTVLTRTFRTPYRLYGGSTDVLPRFPTVNKKYFKHCPLFSTKFSRATLLNGFANETSILSSYP